MSVSFATMGDALAASNLPVRLYCRIGGEPVDISEAHTSHSVDAALGRVSVVLPAPRPASLDLMAEIEVEAGYPGQVHRIFHGVIPNHSLAIDDQGKWIRVTGVGWSYYLVDPDETGLQFDGPISLKEVFRGTCEHREVPAYRSEETYLPSGSEIMLGGNPQHEGGAVTIDARTSPRSFGDRAAGLFGYRQYDRPDGEFRQSRVSGLPVDTAAWTFSEGVDCFRLSQSVDVRPMRTYWVVEGASYTDADGVAVQVRSIAEAVADSAYLPPLGYRKETITDGLLTTDTLAEGCRNVMEHDHAAPDVRETLEVRGNPLLMPGEVVTLTSASMEVTSEARWLLSVDHDVDDRGFVTTISTWSGNGEALPAGDDCVSESIGSADAYHLGNQIISRYRDPTPDGTSVTIDIRVPDAEYTSVALSGIAHGTNSYNNRSPSTGSVVEVWQLPEPSEPATGDNELRRVGSVELPTLDEESNRQRNYTPDTYWTPFRLPMPGSLKAGAAEIRLISGGNPDGQDDYEVTDLTLTYCGVGAPVLPGPGGSA
ncbi:MAG: hypothetical protein AB7G88_03360 [Thermomicrobiales bacterium]